MDFYMGGYVEGWINSLLDGWLDRRVGGIGKWVGKQVNEWRMKKNCLDKSENARCQLRMTKAK